jgi:hypothetical protein
MKELSDVYCDRCMCQDASCSLIESARIWIKSHESLIGKRLYEDVATEYPGAPRPFMLAWVDEFGGI